jgi:acetyltransferase
MLMAGLGGVFAEELRDTALWTVPASEAEIRRGLQATALGRILTSSRWKWADSLSLVVDALLSLQSAAAGLAGALTAIDINPLIIGKEGVVAVDALVTIRRDA